MFREKGIFTNLTHFQLWFNTLDTHNNNNNNNKRDQKSNTTLSYNHYQHYHDTTNNFTKNVSLNFKLTEKTHRN